MLFKTFLQEKQYLSNLSPKSLVSYDRLRPAATSCSWKRAKDSNTTYLNCDEKALWVLHQKTLTGAAKQVCNYLAGRVRSPIWRKEDLTDCRVLVMR